VDPPEPPKTAQNHGFGLGYPPGLHFSSCFGLKTAPKPWFWAVFGGIPKKPRAIRAFRPAIWPKHGVLPVPEGVLGSKQLEKCSPGYPSGTTLFQLFWEGIRDPLGGGGGGPDRGFLGVPDTPYPGPLGNPYPGILGNPYPGILGNPYPGILETMVWAAYGCTE